MNQHRIFIAVNLPERLKKTLSECRDKWPELPGRWTKKDNLHITLVFLGYLNSEELLDLSRTVREIASKYSPFSLSLNSIEYAPPGKLPKMVWALGEENVTLSSLQKELEAAIFGLSSADQRQIFRPHITLCRIKMFDFKAMELEERPQLSEEMKHAFEVNSVEIMESKLQRGGPEYIVLESIALK